MFDHPFPAALEAYPTLRQSTLSSFDNCGLSTKMEYDYARGLSTHPQGRGTIFHVVAAECLREMWRMKEPAIPPDAALGILRDVLRQDWADRACPHCGTVDIQKGVTADGFRLCAEGHRFETDLVNVPLSQVKDLYWTTIKWARDQEFDIGKLVDVEQRLQMTLQYHHEGVRFDRILTGQIDAVFVEGLAAERAIVKDWKDTWSLPPAGDEGDDTLSEDGYFQQRFYALLIFKNYPSVQEVVLDETYVRYSQNRKARFFRNMEVEIEEELSALAYRFDRAFQDQAFVPTPGKHCSFCVRPTACPIPRAIAAEGKIVDQSQAEKTARQILVAEEVLKQARKAMRAWCDTHGPIRVRDPKGVRELGYQASKRTIKPTPDDIRRAEVEKGSRLTAEEVAALYKEVPSTRFGVHTPKGGPPETPTDEDLQRQLAESIEQMRTKNGVEPPAEEGQAA